MSAKPDLWMPLYIADYLADTQDLDAERHGAYLLLLMAAWMRGGRLPNDDRKLSTIARCSAAQWKRVKPDVLPFFEVRGEEVVQPRLLAEYEHAVKVNDAQRENGKKGGRPKKNPTQQKPTGFDSLNPKHNPQETPPPPPSFTNDSSSTLGDYERADDDGRALPLDVQAWQAIKQFAGYGPTQCHSASDPRLAAAVDAGVTVAEFAAVALEAAKHTPPKPFGWVIATAAGRHRDANNPGANHADRPQRGRVGLADRNPRPVRQAEPDQHDAIDGEAVRIDS